MTKEQLKRGEEIQREINELQLEIIDQESALTKSGIPLGRKTESVYCQEDYKYFPCKTSEYRLFIESLIKTRKQKIEQLQKEFEEL